MSYAERKVPFDEIEGIASTNVLAYPNKNSCLLNTGRNYLYDIFTGYQWQCVEFARRWLILRKSCTFCNISCADNMWNKLHYIEQITDGKHFSLRAIFNGSSKPPTKDSLLIYPRSLNMPFGHVTVITDVVNDHIHIAEQNHHFTYWPVDYARRAPIRHQNGNYFIDDADPIYGWMEIENNEQLELFDESKINLIRDEYRNPPSKGIFDYLFTSDRRKDSKSTTKNDYCD
ncbi:unnamed protein product [Rotaria sp. Silwood1]|nr:unnamed protein product [Rotaria sp. Silwood1]CAF4909447.1 unnamed protein product [Rotaria sp. Silwood1]